MKKHGYNVGDRTRSALPSAIQLVVCAIMLMVLSVAVASDELEFKVSTTAMATLEGDNAKILVIETGHERFEMRVPKNYGSQVNAEAHSIVFTSQTGSSIITVKMSTNYAGTLPKADELRGEVAKKYASASLVQTSTCHTTCGTGLLFDLFQPASGDLTMRIRDGFISFREGSFEFTLSCDVREYDQNRISFAWLLNSFHLQTESAKQDL